MLVCLAKFCSFFRSFQILLKIHLQEPSLLGFSGILSVLNLLYLCFFLFRSLDCQFSVVQGNVWLAF